VDATLYRTRVGAGADRTAPTTGAPGKAGVQGPAGSSRACTWPCATPASGIVRKLHGTYLGPAIPPGRREPGEPRCRARRVERAPSDAERDLGLLTCGDGLTQMSAGSSSIPTLPITSPATGLWRPRHKLQEISGG
jgi:hypothetical protein